MNHNKFHLGAHMTRGDNVFLDGKWYDAIGGSRLTNCCHCFSTFCDGDVLCCKSCYREVEFGEGDGSERIPPHLEKPIERGGVEERVFLLLEDLLNVRGAAMRLVISVSPSNTVTIDKALGDGLVRHDKGRGRFNFGTPKDQVLYLTKAGKRWFNEARTRKWIAFLRRTAKIKEEHAQKREAVAP